MSDQPQPQQAKRSLRIFLQPNTNSPAIGIISARRMVRVLASQGDWIFAEDVENPALRGYTHRLLLELPHQVVGAEIERPAGATGMGAKPQPKTEAELATEPKPEPIPETTPEPAPTPEPEPVPATVTPEPEPTTTPTPPAAGSPETADMEPADKIAEASTAAERAVKKVWNHFGGLLSALANEYKIDVAAAVAVMAVESGGEGFGPDGRLKIRFENHLFYRNWGNQNQEIFNKHFVFDQNQQWKGHMWRPTESEDWRTFHGNQTTEWEVFDFARTLKGKAAKLSVSIGAPQILGSNFQRCGYDSVQSMWDDFADSLNGERYQAIALFKFIETDSLNRGIPALQQGDYSAFAEMYNGSGNAASYGKQIADRVEAFKKLRGA